ncbi:MAG: acetoin utilization protein AcuC [Coriobacteriia bacterium]
MRVELIYAPEMGNYRFGVAHPMQPERFTLAVELARDWGLLGADGVAVVRPLPATDSELLLAHDSAYVNAVKRASADANGWHDGFGIGAGDTPAFAGMHEAAALATGATVRGLRDVVAGTCLRAFSPAGGLHHAHRDRAAGFCIYNDLAVGIAAAIAENPGLRIAYVDLDAHHGDGVQEAFWTRSDCVTISVHESGMYLYPGTGRIVETGSGPGEGFALNVPLPPDSGDECYAIVLAEVVAPALRAFDPDVIVVQLGADSHRNDPLTHLDTTVAGQFANAQALVALAEELCGGRILATGGGGYDTYSAAPRAWACVLAALLGVEPPASLPEAWREAATSASRGVVTPPLGTFEERAPEPPAEARDRALAGTADVVAQLRATHPLLRGV